MTLQTAIPLVVAIGGTSGAGKTTLIHGLAALFDHAPTLHLDDYQEDSTYPDVSAWLAGGADPNAFVTPRLVHDVHLLRRGEPVRPMGAAEPIQPSAVILVEEPFGRARAAMHDLVDLVIYIDLPLDLALARKVARRLGEGGPASEVLAGVREEFLPWYIAVGHQFYQAIDARARPGADVVLDGRQTRHALLEHAAEHIRQHLAAQERR
jgi:uridine kinase